VQPADAEPVRLNGKLIEDFVAFSRDVKRNTPRWVWEQSRYLDGWKDALGEVDLRKVSLGRDIEPALKGDGAFTRQKKIAVIKALYGWLRKVRHEISPAEDPTLDALPVPQSEPAQWGKVKAFTPKQFEKVREQVAVPVFADAMTVQAATGWHTTEVVRFAEGGAVEDLPAGTINPDGDLVIVCPLTKGGEPLKTRVSIAAGEAARRLRDAGKLDRKLYDAALREANVKAGFKVGTVSGGRFRHSVATWAINRGASPKDVSAFLGHKSERTTKKFYATHAIPTKVPTLV
jgi:integrase